VGLVFLGDLWLLRYGFLLWWMVMSGFFQEVKHSYQLTLINLNKLALFIKVITESQIYPTA
jgi:hypothetical protein